MPVAPLNADDSFGPGAETSTPKMESRRYSLPAAPTENDIVRKRVLSYTTSKPTQKMVLEAIRVIGSEDEKGASVAAITKWIIGNHAILDMDRVKLGIKRAILKALEQGTIQRSATSKRALGASGSFVLRIKGTSSKSKAAISSKQKKAVEKEISSDLKTA